MRNAMVQIANFRGGTQPGIWPLRYGYTAHIRACPGIHQGGMMAKAYWVVCYRAINDTDAFQRYTSVAPAAVQAQGGRFLVRGMAARVYEAGMMQRVVVIEFDSLAQALATHDSP